MKLSRLFLFGVFFLSGTAGIVYEILWMRELQRLFGNTAVSAAIVLFVFFLGMALGNIWGGRFASKATMSFRWYGIVEIGIAVLAAPALLLSPIVLHLQSVFLSTAMSTWMGYVINGGVVLVLMLPASILIGATFPLLGTVLVQQREMLGRDAGRLYGINTFGAVGGVLLVGFLLPPLLGNFNTYALALLINVTLGVVVLAWCRFNPDYYQGHVLKEQDSFVDDTQANGRTGVLPRQVLLAVAFGSGFGTIALEVLWTRMFSLVFQNSVYSFSAIVLVFLIGLALGALIITGSQKILQHSVAMLGMSLGVTALCVILTPMLFSQTTGFAYFEYGVGWPLYIFKILALVAGIIIAPVIAAGCVLPLLWKLYESFRHSVGITLGGVNLWNLLGALSGGILAAFVLIPTMGLWNAIVAIGCLFLLLSQVVLFYGKTPSFRIGSIVFAVVFPIVIIFLANPMQYSSQRVKPGEHLMYIDEGREAVISVVQDRQNITWLKSNNTYNLGATIAVQGEKRLGHLPLLLHPEPKDVAFVGVATGISMSAGLDHALNTLLGIEILPGVLGALTYFKRENQDLLNSENVTTVVKDGRVYLRNTKQTFDVIVSDLFVPWHAGTGNLYTLEHYQASAKRLNPQGLYCQWLPLYQLSEREFGIIAATMAEAFPHVSVWRGDYSAKAPIIGLIGSKAPIVLDMASIGSRVEALQRRMTPKDQLLETEDGVLLLYGGDLATVRPWLQTFPVNTDDHPVIEFEAPKSQTRREMYLGMELEKLYVRLSNSASSEAAVQIQKVSENQVLPLSSKPGNLVFRAVVQGVEKDIAGQLLTIRELTQLLKGTDYRDIVRFVLRSVDSSGIRREVVGD